MSPEDLDAACKDFYGKLKSISSSEKDFDVVSYCLLRFIAERAVLEYEQDAPAFFDAVGVPIIARTITALLDTSDNNHVSNHHQ